MSLFSESFYTDINKNSTLEKLLPAFLSPYVRLARLDRPIGILLLLQPCLWGLLLGSEALPSFSYIALYCVGAVLMRGAGCTYNDLVDADIDAKVQRTRERPLPGGTITKQQALIFFGVQLFLSFIILIQLPDLTVVLGGLSLGLVLFYPWMKRLTYWPQVFLGLTFNWGVLMGWSTASGSLSMTAIFLYLGGLFWTMLYDTIYAHQDRSDDFMAGVKSTALKWGAHTSLFLTLLSVLSLSFWGLAGWWGTLGSFYFYGLCAVTVHFLWQILTLKKENPQDCLQKFKSNQWVGWLLLLSIIGGKYL